MPTIAELHSNRFHATCILQLRQQRAERAAQRDAEQTALAAEQRCFNCPTLITSESAYYPYCSIACSIQES